MAEDLISRLRFLFWGNSNGTGRDHVSVDPESMVVGTRCNFVCMTAMARGNAFLQMHDRGPQLTQNHAKIDGGTVYIQCIFVQCRGCIFEIYDHATASA